jgi:glycosyltransferase involved in cell wall biosynthesis
MTSQEPQVWVVIAAYNEAPVIASVVADVKCAGYRALVVDDGSTDATGVVAAEAGCIVLRHSLNLGQGAALQTGIDFALSEGADVIVTFDADGGTAPPTSPY